MLFKIIPIFIFEWILDLNTKNILLLDIENTNYHFLCFEIIKAELPLHWHKPKITLEQSFILLEYNCYTINLNFKIYIINFSFYFKRDNLKSKVYKLRKYYNIIVGYLFLISSQIQIYKYTFYNFKFFNKYFIE